MPRIRFTHSAETDLLELWVTIAETSQQQTRYWMLSRQQQRSWAHSRRWAERARNWPKDCAVCRPVRHTSFSICPMTMDYWSFACCIMQGILMQNTFLRESMESDPIDFLSRRRLLRRGGCCNARPDPAVRHGGMQGCNEGTEERQEGGQVSGAVGTMGRAKGYCVTA